MTFYICADAQHYRCLSLTQIVLTPNTSRALPCLYNHISPLQKYETIYYYKEEGKKDSREIKRNRKYNIVALK